jgi:transposase InsO family protein
VLDLGSRRLPGFAMSEHHDSAVAKAALCMAAAVRGGDADGVIFHSDKGGEYVGDLFSGACASLGVTQSMGRVGSALDNAASESWLSSSVAGRYVLGQECWCPSHARQSEHCSPPHPEIRTGDPAQGRRLLNGPAWHHALGLRPSRGLPVTALSHGVIV